MIEALYPFFEWADTTWLAEAIKQSMWLFAVIMALHLVAFAALGGSILLVDLRLLGVLLPDQSPKKLADAARPWFWGALAGMAVTGVLMFFSETMKLYHNDPFWSKMRFLVLGLLFTLTVRRAIVKADPERVGHWAKPVAMVNIVLWAGVAWGGRWIGFW